MWHHCHPSILTHFWECAFYLESQAQRMGHRLRASALELISLVDQNSEPLCFWDLTAGCNRYLGTAFAGFILSFTEGSYHNTYSYANRTSKMTLLMESECFGAPQDKPLPSCSTGHTGQQNKPDPMARKTLQESTVMVFYCKCKWIVEIKLSFNGVNGCSESFLRVGKGWGKKCCSS